MYGQTNHEKLSGERKPVESWKGDVVVLGAGPAGAWAAARIASTGAKVALIDRRSCGNAGAQWVNGVASWTFERAGITPPLAPELRGNGERFTILSPGGEHRVDVESSGILEVDMRLLGSRLARCAQEAGAEIWWDTRAVSLACAQNGRPHTLQVQRKHAGKTSERNLRASLWIDASGMGAFLRRRIPKLASACPPPRPIDMCAAAQEVRTITDRDGARRFLAKHRAVPGQTLAWTGRWGGYSVLNVLVGHNVETVSILTGATALTRYPSGRKILHDFVATQPWIGDVLFGGARALPLRRPYTRLAAPGIALLGDAACQVYAIHGSGIGMGLIAARVLADVVGQTLQQGRDPGALVDLWNYPAQFHRTWGGLLGVADVFRRFSQSLQPEEVTQLMAHGLLTARSFADGLAQRPAKIHLRDLPQMLWGALQAPKLALRLAPIVARLPWIQALTQTYPAADSSHTQVDLYRYERRMRRLIETVPQTYTELLQR